MNHTKTNNDMKRYYYYYPKLHKLVIMQIQFGSDFEISELVFETLKSNIHDLTIENLCY